MGTRHRQAIVAFSLDMINRSRIMSFAVWAWSRMPSWSRWPVFVVYNPERGRFRAPAIPEAWFISMVSWVIRHPSVTRWKITSPAWHLGSCQALTVVVRADFDGDCFVGFASSQ
jgi:hypothetical protein